MNVTLYHDQEIIAEAMDILLQHMAADKLAHLIATIQQDKSDYLAIRETLFAEETVDSLYQQIVKYQTS